VRRLLRSLPVFDRSLPSFAAREAPDEPVALFTAWLTEAIDAGALEPHAMTLSTVDQRGRPDARMLILKDVGDDGWAFPSSATSTKGQQLAATPDAALNVYWPVVGRQVRIRGRVHLSQPADSARDFLARSPSARAEALVGRQSQVLADPEEMELEVAQAAADLAADPELVAPAWTLYRLVAEEVEFWQAAASRRHIRLRYRRTRDSAGRCWAKEVLWP
jgi:pyridoxamine 5'-phosphate oxidase